MPNLDENALNIFTDGSSYSQPRKGGVGAVFVTVDENGHEVAQEYSPAGYTGATNNQMELQACIDVLKAINGKYPPVDISNFNKVIIYTDSRYVVDNIMSAIWYWPRASWLDRNGAPILNASLWKELTKHIKKTPKRVELEWIKGHSSSKHNKIADKLAKSSARNASKQTIATVNIRRKLSHKSVQLGSVGIEGQRVTIRIISDEYLKVQKRIRYKYEVISRTSKYRHNVDIAYSDLNILLRAGHTYNVRLGDNGKNPTIEKLFKEVKKSEVLKPNT